MSALKSGDENFTSAYLDILCDRETVTVGSASRRSVLVDIAYAPQGLQIVTQVRI